MKKRSYEKELMDLGGFSDEDFHQNLHELKLTNRFLGGHRASLHAFKKCLPEKGGLRIADVGCGGADTLIVLANYCRKHQIPAEFYGIDCNATGLGFARKQCEDFDNIRFIASDYRELDQQFDLIYSSLFTHHLNENQLVEFVLWCEKHAEKAYFFNDLHRHWLALQSIRLLTSLIPVSYLYKNDAPLSVRRGFLKKEWASLGQALGIPLEINWHWAFRHTVCRIK